MYFLFLCVYVNWTYWLHVGLNTLLNFAHGSEVRRLIGIEQKNIKFEQYYERALLESPGRVY